MKLDKFNLLLLVIIALLIGVIVFNSNSNTEIDKYALQKREIDSLSNLIANLEKDQLKQDSLIKLYTDSLKTIDYQIDSTKIEIEQIQKQYGKKIKDIHNATHNELSDFFTERYK